MSAKKENAKRKLHHLVEPGDSDFAPSEIPLDATESYKLANLENEKTRALRVLQDIEGRMAQFAWSIFHRVKMDTAVGSLNGWEFHIDAKGKRVVLKRVKP